MKSLYLLFAVVFLAFQIQAQPNPKSTFQLGSPDLYQVDAFKPVDELAPAQLKKRIPCYGKRGYCFLRQMKCDSGFVFTEQLNDCRNSRTLKCCVLPRTGLRGY